MCDLHVRKRITINQYWKTDFVHDPSMIVLGICHMYMPLISKTIQLLRLCFVFTIGLFYLNISSIAIMQRIGIWSKDYLTMPENLNYKLTIVQYYSINQNYSLFYIPKTRLRYG
jgi:hypothetical protein